MTSEDLKKKIACAASSMKSEPEELTQKSSLVYQKNPEKNELFKCYPILAQRLSYISLAEFPSPIIRCHHLEKIYPNTHIFIKNDGAPLPHSTQQGINLGANKLRKLQYILADARAQGSVDLITFGCVGSHHVLETTASGKKLGFSCWNMLLDQPNSAHVRNNLLLNKALGGNLIYCSSRAARIEQSYHLFMALYNKTGKQPSIIPTGGSSPRGTIGFVEALYELKVQIDAGQLPLPTSIYLPVGSAGIAAGILLGIKSLNLPIHVYCILIEPDNEQKELTHKIDDLFYHTNNLLYSYDREFPLCTLSKQDYTVIPDHAGLEYGLFTQEGIDALRCMYDAEKIVLDGTYSAKACAGLLYALKHNRYTGKTILFWNSFCSQTYEEITNTIDYRSLPEPFQPYFTNPVQPLDLRFLIF